MDDDDFDCCGETVVVCCCAGSSSSGSSSSGSGTSSAVSCCCALLSVLALAALLVAAFAFVVPVRVTVDDATLGRLALAAPAPASGAINGTGNDTAAAALSYDVSLAVAVHNHNWAMAVWRHGPLDAELRFRGVTFARARLAGGGGRRDKIRALKMLVYRMAAAGESALLLGPDAAAELARERAAGAFELELAVFGEAQYEAHPGRRVIRVTCPLKLSLSTATAPAAFARVKCA